MWNEHVGFLLMRVGPKAERTPTMRWRTKYYQVVDCHYSCFCVNVMHKICCCCEMPCWEVPCWITAVGHLRILFVFASCTCSSCGVFEVEFMVISVDHQSFELSTVVVLLNPDRTPRAIVCFVALLYWFVSIWLMWVSMMLFQTQPVCFTCPRSILTT